MHKIFRTLLGALLATSLFAAGGNAMADHITISATGACPSADTDCDAGVDDSYSFLIEITDADAGTDGNPDTFSSFTVTLTNTTSGAGNDALIDNFWFSLNYGALSSTDPSFSNFNPDTWDVLYCADAGPGNPCNVTFTYAGDPDTQDDRLGPGESLSFTMTFTAEEVGFDVFTSAASDTGIGGGNDLGQVCVSFQRLDGGGTTNEESDQVCGDWGDDTTTKVPEPGTMALLGLGLVGIGIVRRRRTTA